MELELSDPTSYSISSTSTRRSRNGCQQCRKRKKKCDEHHPQCFACTDRNLTCSWEREPRRTHVARRQSHFNKDFSVPQAMNRLINVFPVPSPTIKETLLTHFQNNSRSWLTSGGDSSACLSMIMPVALRNPLVLNCILALAAGDLAKYQPASSGTASLTCGFYGQAVAGVNRALGNQAPLPSSLSKHVEPTSTDNGDDLLLAIMLLCIHEAVNFTAINRILPHLTAAAAICHKRCFFDTEPNNHLRGFLLEVFCYMFTLTAFTHGHTLPLHLASEVLASPFLSDDYYTGILLGQRCRIIFSIILRVSVLRNSNTFVSGLDEAAMFELRTIKAQLEDERNFLDTNDETSPTDEKTSTELYRLACLITVKKTLDPTLADGSADIKNLLSRFSSILHRLSPTSPVNNILCWPLFVAGMSATVVSHQRIIIGRLRASYESSWRSDILSKSADILSKRSRQKAEANGEAIDHQDMGQMQWVTSAVQTFDFPLVLL